ncbi:MAG: DUF1232 domain-containing protein [Clostridiales bacterium]|nr:DUF1232 domain-containing protein [Clostridiales bacterium]
MKTNDLNNFDAERIIYSYENTDEVIRSKMEAEVHEKIFDFVKKWAKKLGKELVKSIQYLWDALIDPQVPWKAKSIVISSLAYAISPVDAIPDFLPGGFADDAIVLAAAVAAVAKILVQHGININVSKTSDMQRAANGEDVF